MEPTTLTIIVPVVAMLIAGYAMWQARKAGTPITGSLLTATLEESTPKATELTEAALTGARAAEQLWKTGKIQRDARLDKAFAYVRKFFPDLDQATILTAIESAVLVVNTVVDAMPKKSAPTPPAPLTGYDAFPGRQP